MKLLNNNNSQRANNLYLYLHNAELIEEVEYTSMCRSKKEIGLLSVLVD